VEAGKKRKRRQKENFGSVDMLINYADTCVWGPIYIRTYKTAHFNH
jgi:hypothetical protein